LADESAGFIDWCIRLVDESLQKHGTGQPQPQMIPDLDRFGEITPEVRQAYLRRPPNYLPRDLVNACDEIRRQKKEINTLRGQLLQSKKENEFISAKYGVVMGIIGGLAFKGLSMVLVHFLK
jgi:hypothetical protein